VSSQRERFRYELLVLRCQRRERAAFEEMIRTWEDRLYYYIRRLVEDEENALDILQQVWLRVMNGIAKLRQPDALPAWLYRTARNTAMTFLRSRGRWEESVDVASLPDGVNRREILTLFFLEDLSVQEISEVLEVPEGTVKSRLHFAKRALLAVLEKEDAKYE
jgi:RNA polymerase sigma-70 factor (ECF subfamily)